MDVIERTYEIYVCPDCGDGPEVTAFIPGCGPQAIKRGDNLRQCPCGFKGEYIALEVRPVRDGARRLSG